MLRWGHGGVGLRLPLQLMSSFQPPTDEANVSSTHIRTEQPWLSFLFGGEPRICSALGHLAKITSSEKFGR